MGINVDAKTLVYGLIGNPVRHSRSPQMHNAAFRSLGINAVYVCFEVRRKEDLKKAIDGIRTLGLAGVNVTVPYKEAVIKFLDEITLVSKRIGAVNTIFWRGDKLIGTNTDAEGFIRDLRDTCRFSAKNKKILIIGAGGASRAVSFALADAGAVQIYLTDIDYSKVKKLVTSLKKEYPGCVIAGIKSPEIEKVARNIDLLVNATPVGMKEGDPEVVDLNLFNRNTLVYDLVYSPSITPLLRRAKKLKMPCANGLGMLLRQGALAFKHWTGKNPPIEVMEKALRRIMK